MSTFDPSGYKSSNNIDVNQQIAEIASLATRWAMQAEVNNSATPIQTISSSYTSLDSFTVSLESDELIVVIGRLVYSMDNSSTLGAVHVYNSTAAAQTYPDSVFTQHVNSVAGLSATQFTFGFDHSRSGSTTYQLRWRRAAGSGILYTAYCQMGHLIFKQQ